VTRHVLDAGVGDPAPRPGWSVIDIGDRLRGGRFDGDLVPEGFKFADEPAFAGAGVVDAAGEIVRAEVAVGGVLGEHMPDDHDQGMGGGGRGLLAAFLAEAAVKATELGTDIGAGAPRGPGALGEDLTVALCEAGATDPSGNLTPVRN
jgi:hypothetical protein